MLPAAASIAFLYVLPAPFHGIHQLLFRPHVGHEIQSPTRPRGLQNSLSDDRDTEDDSHQPFRAQLEQLGLAEVDCNGIVDKLCQVDLLENSDSSAQALELLALDFVQRPEAFSTILISDFGLAPLQAHQIRAAVMIQLKKSRDKDLEGSGHQPDTRAIPIPKSIPLSSNTLISVDSKDTQSRRSSNQEALPLKDKIMEEFNEPRSRPTFKSVVVNRQAKLRKGKETVGDEDHDYGLPSDYKSRFPVLASELEDFYTYMTKPSTASQESTIREATATVYLRHAKLFLGYYHSKSTNKTVDDKLDETFSLYQVFPTRDKESADPVLGFILWLRSSRKISVSYEANLLRGLTKLLKFRFTRESTNDPSYGEKAFDDVPLIREIRKLHREANQRQRLAPRSSDEKQKWLSWPDYLQVVSLIQKELATSIKNYSNHDQRSLKKPKTDSVSSSSLSTERAIATLFQKYLILAIFASVPDRQRTIRELAVGRNFEKDSDTGCWCIRHAPEDYKTGKAYGERPPLRLAEPLTPEIDGFLNRWRPCLSPQSDAVFVQPRTGKPLTQDSVYQIVSRCCYQYMGKRTNPHLLRDMLVTHVRESNASEKQLEALALYMGHSIQMQRTSYDRRTLTKKVAPAVELMIRVNGETHPDQ